MNFLEFLKDCQDEVLTGTYYARRPIIEGYNGAVKTDYNDHGVPFRYDIVDDKASTYQTMIGTLRADRTLQTIKTDADIDFIVDGYVKAQDGGFYQISEVIKRIAPPKNKQALRWFKTTIKTTRVLRMIEVDNPFNL